MRTFSATIIALALLVGSTVGVTAQMNDETIPAVFVTGTVVDDTANENEGRVVYTQEVAWSDPRLPSSLQVNAAWYVSGESVTDAVMTMEMNLLLEGPDGLWRGTGRAIEAIDGRYSYYVLIGEGAYEGLHALLRGAPGIDVNGPWDEDYQGWLFEGELPPLPAPPES